MSTLPILCSVEKSPNSNESGLDVNYLSLGDKSTCQFQSVIDMGAEMILADSVIKSAALHNSQRLLINMGENQLNIFGFAALIEGFKGIHCSGIYSGHCTHTQDKHMGELLELDIQDLVGSAEEHGAADLVHADVLLKPLIK